MDGHQERILTRAIELDPQLGTAYSYISEAYRLKGMTAEAIENSTKAIVLGAASRTIGRAYATRAKSYRSLGMVEEADQDFKRALRSAPEYIDYTFFTVTEFLADSAAESSSVKRVGLMGVFMVIGLVFVGIFRLVLPSPKKRY
jgi:tetratricopeptide (TPR) repeat protein